MADRIDYFAAETDATALRGRAVRGALYTAVSQGLRVALSVASQIILSHLLLPAQFGIVAMAAPVLAFVGVFNTLGLAQAIIQREHITQDDLSALYWLGLGVSSACALAIALVSPLVALAYRQPAVCPVVIALAIQMPIGALAGHASALMTRKMRFGAIAVVEVLSAVVGLAASIGLALGGAGYWALVWGQLAAAVTQAAGDRLLSGWRPSRPRWSPTVAPMLRFGANLTGYNVLSLFSMYSDNVVVGLLSGPRALGLFDRAFSLVLRPLGSLTAPVGRVATPLLARILGDPEDYRRTYLAMLQGMILLGAPGLLVGAAMAQELVSALLGPAWTGAAPIIALICIAAIFTPFSSSSAWMFTSQDRTHDQLRCGMISSGLILASMLVGLPWGPVGIAAAYATFAPVVHGGFTWVATRRGPVRALDVLKSVYPAAVSLLGAAMALRVLHEHAGGGDLARLAIGLCLSYAATFVIFLLFPGGRRSLATAMRLRRHLGSRL